MSDDEATTGPRFTFGDLVLTPTKTAFWVPVSREAALMHGLVEPTAEERAAQEQARADLERRRAAAAVLIPADLARLDAIDDPLIRRLLDHHGRRSPRYGTEWVCGGCDAQGYEVDDTTWPCSTVDLIAGHFGIGLVDAWLFARPEDGSLDQGEPA